MRLIIRRAPGPYAPRTVVDGRCPKLGSTLTQLGARSAPAQEQSEHHATLTANLDPAKRNACAQYAFGLLLTATNLFDNDDYADLRGPLLGTKWMYLYRFGRSPHHHGSRQT